jgi:hypothetical protein
MPGDSGASAVNTRVHTYYPPAHTALPRRAPHVYIVGMGRCDVVVLGEAAIDQIAGGLVAFDVHVLDLRLCQAAIRTAGVDVYRNDHMVFRRRFDLPVETGGAGTELRHFFVGKQRLVQRPQPETAAF